MRVTIRAPAAALALGFLATCATAASIPPPAPKAAAAKADAAAKAEAAAVRPLHLASGSAWDGTQFLQADKKGRLFLLRGKTLEVFRLNGEGGLEPVSQVAEGSSAMVGRPLDVWQAAMSPQGDWVVQDGFETRILRDGEEKLLTGPQWAVSAVGFLGDAPVIAGSPVEVDHARAFARALPESVDLIAAWDDKWEPLVSATAKAKQALDPLALSEQRMVRLAGTADGHLWVGFEFERRFREYSPAGKLLTEIVVGGGEAKPAADAEARKKRMAGEAEQFSAGLSARDAAGGGKKVPVEIFEVTAEPVTRALAPGRDGHVYFLVRGAAGDKGGMALERYDSASGKLERLPLDISDPGLTTMAAGKDGLYIAAVMAKAGIWSLTWEELEAASWSPVEEAKISGG